MLNISAISKGVVQQNIADAIVKRNAQKEYKLCTRSTFNPERISAEHLDVILDIANLTVPDAYAGCKYKPTMPREFRDVLADCKGLKASDFDALTTIAESLVEPWWKNPELNTMSARAGELMHRRTTHESRYDPEVGVLSPHMETLWVDPRAKANIDELPDVAQRLDVTLHWLLCLPNRTYFQVPSAKAQGFIDTYSLLPAGARKIMRSVIRTYVAKKTESEVAN